MNNYLHLIQKFEKTFIQAGELAVKLRSEVKSNNKFATGHQEVDIVTSADLAVQEYILQELAKSELKELELVGEEEMASRKLFANKSDLVLTVDPIDGTSFYASGKKMYSVIISIHNKHRPIYTFAYWPEVKWGVKIVEDRLEWIGKKPEFNIAKHPHTICYSPYFDFDPARQMPEIFKQLSGEGFKFINKKEISEDVGGTALFLLGYADGYCSFNASPVDCLVSMHFGMANGYKVHKNLNLSTLVPSKYEGGIGHYEGWYVVVR